MNTSNNAATILLHIPTRREFHREYAGEVMLADFDTHKPNPDRHIAYVQKELEQRREKENLTNEKAF